MSRSMIPCASCRTPLMANAGETAISCQNCGGVTLTAIKCLGCGVSLACSAKSPAISCSVCTTVTMIQDRQAKCIANPAQCPQCFSQLLVPQTQHSVKCPKCHVVVSSKSTAKPATSATPSSSQLTSRSGYGTSSVSTASAYGAGGIGAAAAAATGGQQAEVAVELEHLILDPPENTSFGFTTAKYSILEQMEVEPSAPPVCTFTDAGLPVTYVMEPGAAARAGMRAGDVIVRVNGADVSSYRATQVVESVRTAARPVRIDVLRRNQAAVAAAMQQGAQNDAGRTQSVKTGFFSRLGEGFKTLARGTTSNPMHADNPTYTTTRQVQAPQQAQRTHVLRDGPAPRPVLSAAEEEKAVAALVAITGVELVQAYEILERVGWDLRRAIDVQTAALGGSTPQPSVVATAPLQLPSVHMPPAAAPPLPSMATPAPTAREQMIDQVVSVLGLDRGVAEALLCDSNWRVDVAIERGLELPRNSPKPEQQQQQMQLQFQQLQLTQPPPQQQMGRPGVVASYPHLAPTPQQQQQQPAQQQQGYYAANAGYPGMQMQAPVVAPPAAPAPAYPMMSAGDQPAPPPALPAWITDPARAAAPLAYGASQVQMAQPAQPQHFLAPQQQPPAAPPSIFDAPIASPPPAPAAAPAAAAAPPAADASAEWKDVKTWLDSIGMGQHERVFVEQELLDPSSICELTEDDLKELGFTLIGTKKKLMAAINRLRAAHNLPAAAAN